MADTQTVLQAVFANGGTTVTVNLFAVTDGDGNYVLESQPRVNSAPVATANPMPVADAAAEASLVSIAANTGTIIANTTSLATSAGQNTGNGYLEQIVVNTGSASTAGLATAANQVSGNNSLGTIVANTGSVVAQIGTVITNTTSLATAAAQSTGNAALTAIETNTTGLATAAGQATALTELENINTGVASVATNTTTANEILNGISAALVGTLAATLTGSLPAGTNQIGMTMPQIGASNAGSIVSLTTADAALSLTLPGKVRIGFPPDIPNTTTAQTGMVQISYSGGNSRTAPGAFLSPGQIDDWIDITGTTQPHVSINSGTGTIVVQQ